MTRTAQRSLGSTLDHLLIRRTMAKRFPTSVGAFVARALDTPQGIVRLVDTGGDKPPVVIVPDGPNVIEHYAELLVLLAPDVRVVCFDLPGFGFSVPRASYRHTLDDGASVVLSVLDALRIPRATLAFSCANGLYALRVARLAQERVAGLVLSQTPSISAMLAWSDRTIPFPLRVPALGQVVSFGARKAFAHRWYDMALPRGVDRAPWRALSHEALTQGGCFSLAGVVQGMSRGVSSEVDRVTVPCTSLWGAADHTHRQTRPESLLACAPAASIVTLEGCGHFPDLERSAIFAEHLLRQVQDDAR